MKAMLLMGDLDKPARGYVHSFGLEEFGDELAAARYMHEVVSGDNVQGINAQFMLATVYSFEGDRYVEIVGGRGVPPENWKGNANYAAWEFKNGLWQMPNEIDGTEYACGEFQRVCGKEDDFRTFANSLEEYMGSIPPNLGDLHPPKFFDSNDL
jgi:hypothetical protein